MEGYSIFTSLARFRAGCSTTARTGNPTSVSYFLIKKTRLYTRIRGRGRRRLFRIASPLRRDEKCQTYTSLIIQIFLTHKMFLTSKKRKYKEEKKRKLIKTPEMVVKKKTEKGRFASDYKYDTSHT